jgi:predicted nucleic acid-binding protein
LRAYATAVTRLLASFGGQPFELAPLNETDLSGIATILARYNNMGLQLADASLVHLANREEIENIFTLNRRALRAAAGRRRKKKSGTLRANV